MNVNILSMNIQFSLLFVRKRIIFLLLGIYKTYDKRATRTGPAKTAAVIRQSPAHHPPVTRSTLAFRPNPDKRHNFSLALLKSSSFPFIFSPPSIPLPFFRQVSFADLSSSHHHPAVSHHSPGGAPPSPPTAVLRHPR